MVGRLGGIGIGALLSLFLAIMPARDAAHAVPPLELYGRLPAYELAVMSPSGDRIALLGTIDGKRQIVVLEGGRRLYSLPAGNEKMRRLSWAGEEHVLLFSSETALVGLGLTQHRGEVEAVRVVPLNGKRAWDLFAGSSVVGPWAEGYFGAIERGGHSYGYFGGTAIDQDPGGQRRPRSDKPSLFEVDLDTHRARKIADAIDARFGERDWLIGADGKVAATLDFFADSANWTLRTRGHGVVASGTAPLGGIALVAISADGGGIVYHIDDPDDETGRYFVEPMAGGAPTELLAGERISSISIDDASRRIIGFTRAGDIPELHLLDAQQDSIVAAARKRFPGVSFRLVDASGDFGRLLVETSGTGDPQTLWTIDSSTGRADRLAVAYPMAAAEVGPVRMFAYVAGDGLAMAGVLTLPPDRPPKALPLIMLPHGGPADRDYPVFDWWAQAFASRGYAVFQPNFRGSAELGAPFEKAGRNQWGRKMQSDLTDGLAALAKSGIVDPKRACIVGGSYGGYAALAGVTLQQNIYRCAVSVAGVADVSRLAADWQRTSDRNPAVDRWLRVEMGEGQDLKAISPINFADRASAPILLIHGNDDSVVPLEQSRDMAAALARAGKPVELVELPGEDHWLSKSETRLTMLKAAIDFVEKYNPPEPPLSHAP